MISPARRGLGTVLSVLLAGLVLSPAALSVSSPMVTGPPPGVTLFHGSQRVALFKSAKCTVNGFGFIALTPKNAQGYYLFVHIAHFTGFHSYALLPGGPGDGPYASVGGPNGQRFSSLNRPPFPAPGSGQVNFAGATRMSVGYGPAAFNLNGSDGVVFAGGLTCHFPRHRRG